MSPKERIRRNDLSHRPIEEFEHKTPKEFFNRAAGNNHENEFDEENKQLSAINPFALFLATISILSILICLVGSLFAR